jgi:hypothetical protein
MNNQSFVNPNRRKRESTARRLRDLESKSAGNIRGGGDPDVTRVPSPMPAPVPTPYPNPGPGTTPTPEPKVKIGA